MPAAGSSAPMVRTSERTAFKHCRWAWDRGFNDHLKPHQEAPALRFGSLIHKALEIRYPTGVKRGPKPAGTFEKLFKKEEETARKEFGFVDEDGEWQDMGELGVEMMEHFIEVYGRDEEWRVIQSEQTFKIPVYSPKHPEGGYIDAIGKRIKGKRVLFYYVGTMDGVWQNRMDGGVRIIDWKTTRNDPTKSASYLALDEQATAYWTWGVDWLRKKKLMRPKDLQALDGMLYTYLRKGKKDERPVNADGHYLNQDGSVSKNQPPPYFHRELVYRSETDREMARQRALDEFKDMTLIRLGHLAAYKTPGTMWDPHCNWCSFNDICELHEIGADWESMRDSTMTVWDPYSAHEIEEEGKR